MFWPLSLLFRRRPNRYVFQYRDGYGNRRSADPMEVEAAFMDALGEDWRDIVTDLGRPVVFGVAGDAATAALAARAESRKRVLAAIDAAFGLEPYRDGYGMTQVERLGLLDGFLRFCNDLVRIARPFLNAPPRASPTPTPPAPPPPRASTSAAPTLPAPMPVPPLPPLSLPSVA